MGIFNAHKLTRILPSEVADILWDDPRWVWLLLGAASLVAVLEAATLASLLLLGYAVLDQEPSGTLGELLGQLFYSEYSQRDLLILLSSAVITFVAIRLAIQMTYRYLGYKWSSSVVRRLQKEIMRRIVSAPMRVLDERQLGVIVHDLINAPTGAIAAVDSATALLSAMFLIGSMSVMLIVISPWLLLISAGIAFCWFFTIIPPLQKKMQHYQSERYELQSHGMKIATDTINGIREIRSLGSELRWIDEFSKTVDQWETTRGRIVIWGGIPGPALQAMLQIAFATAIIFAAVLLSPGDLVAQLPVLGTFAYGLFRAYPLMGQISQAWIGMSQAVPNLRAARDWTEMPGDPLANGTQNLDHPIEQVKFDHLSFAYKLDEPTILDANFHISAGKVTALVGTSGAGKSTLIDLLLKFREPSQGILWLGDQNLSDIARQTWLEQVALVRQDVFLFAGTIKENLLEYKPNATDDELVTACQRAGAKEFIDAMPGGLDAQVGERGVTLSGGQRQRIAIARALLRNSEILVLDEAMSALDGETEEQILNALLADSPTRMIILISHRLTTVRNADHIIVLDQGQISEQGTHEELLEKCGRYWELFSSQLGQELPESPDITIN